MKWLAKWLGGHDEVSDADEPARFAPVTARKPVQPAATATRKSDSSEPRPASKPGFDPYNSGSFERRNAWERVNRR